MPIEPHCKELSLQSKLFNFAYFREIAAFFSYATIIIQTDIYIFHVTTNFLRENFECGSYGIFIPCNPKDNETS